MKQNQAFIIMYALYVRVHTNNIVSNININKIRVL